MDMREMNLSKEMYDKKPGLFFSIFIYGLFALVIVALIWAYWGWLDVVVRAHGIIRPNAPTAVVTNAINGELTNVFFYEGQRVQRGDILYVIDTFHLENDRELLIKQLAQLDFELESLKLFQDSIEAGTNLINSFNHEASSRFDSFIVSIDEIEHSANNRLNILQEDESAIATAIAYARFELEMLRAFENSITQGAALFGQSSTIGRNRDVRNHYHNQYLSYTLEIENLNFQIKTAEATLDGFSMIRDSIASGVNNFPYYVVSIYRSMYEEHLLQLEQLKENYALASANYNAYAVLYEVGAAPLVERQAASTMLDVAHARIVEYQTNFAIGIDNEIRNAENTLTRLQNQVELLHVNTLAGISSQTMMLEASVTEMNSRIEQIRLQQESMFFVGYQAGDAAMLRLGEANRTFGQISVIEQEISELQLRLIGINAQINDSMVRAPTDGVVTVHTELIDGGFVMSGVQILSIIPTREDILNATIFISNNDIGHIFEDMIVRFDIAAMPRREFGEITGQITRISTDVAADQGMIGYFLVEAELADKVYYDSRGNGASLRLGMAFEARIVVEQQRILFYLLDRLNLLFN